jgi:CRP/FNR family transcriptional regulator, cyclic AMP receptor protein
MISPLLGKILEEYSEGSNRIGLVEFDGKRRPVYLYLVPEAHAGDYVRFHAGFATERVTISGAAIAPSAAAQGEEAKPDLESLRAYRLLSELDPAQLRKLLPLAQEQHFAAGEIVFQAGGKSSFLHVIVSGDVVLEQGVEEQRKGAWPVEIQTLHAGEAMGWSALGSNAVTHFQARALTPLSTVAFPAEQIRAACESDPALGYALMKRLLEIVTERLDAMRMRLAERAKAQG